MATKTRSSLLRLGLIAGVLALGVAYYTMARHPGSTDGDGQRAAVEQGAGVQQAGNPAAASKADLERTMAQLRERAGTLAAQRERHARPAPDGSLGLPEETVTLAQEIFDEMWAVRGLVHTHEQRTDAARRLLAAPRALELVYHASTDPDFARRAFGEQQAEARYFSILVLEEAARGGQHELLQNAVAVARRGLTSAETFDPGRGEDFRGLLTAYTGVIQPDELNAETLRTLGYDRGLSKEMKQIYYETVFSVLWKREGIEVAEARFREIFPEG